MPDPGSGVSAGEIVRRRRFEVPGVEVAEEEVSLSIRVERSENGRRTSTKNFVPTKTCFSARPRPGAADQGSSGPGGYHRRARRRRHGGMLDAEVVGEGLILPVTAELFPTATPKYAEIIIKTNIYMLYGYSGF